MNELSLFTGAGGGVLGSLLLGHRIIGYVEHDEYCQKVIAQRIKDGILDQAPIFSNIQAFNRAGFAKQYQGLVDIVSGGFPCQDLSCAGKGAGLSGTRSGLFFEMVETVRLCKPRWVFIENVPMLLVRGFERVLGELAGLGFDVAWGIVSAANVGAPHLRKRIWVLAHSERDRCGPRRAEREGQQGRVTFIGASGKVADSSQIQPRRQKQRTKQQRAGEWWLSEPDLGRKVDGLAQGLDLS